ncbi:MAG: competence protein ComK [Bacillota bacterium]|uniref:competence protein ComK n=1 Tax=unclassified Virgibacillus TaxID=2620237 RepID=UPI000EF4EEF6|nr:MULTISPECIES: competence protein ComK [unclassified Virgibacillus]MDY7046468.1 competence protein ComK [Virgibacillus sp. M23]
MEQRITSVYIISPQTKAILLKERSYFRSIILEGNMQRRSLHKPEQIINNSCLLYGSTLDGRRKAVKRILKSSSKLPVPIIPEKGVYMLPTASIKNKSCVWLAYHHIDTYEKYKDQTYIKFFDGNDLLINISHNAFDMQYKRTSQLIVHMNRGFLFDQRSFRNRYFKF